MRTPLSIFSLVFGSIRTEVDPISGKEVFTHLQKYSRCGFLVTFPFCFHIWFFWRKQTYLNGEALGNVPHYFGWVAGTEQGIYCRTPGYRYDTTDGMKWTWGYVGGHWD